MGQALLKRREDLVCQGPSAKVEGSLEIGGRILAPAIAGSL